MARVYHAPAPKDCPPSEQPRKLSGIANHKLKEMMEPTRAYKWGALACMCTPRSVVRTAGENTPGWNRGGGRRWTPWTGTWHHRSGLKNNWHVNQAKILSFNWGPLAPNPNQPTNRLKPSTFQILRRIGENYISPLGFIERHREGRNNNNSLLSAGLKQ